MTTLVGSPRLGSIVWLPVPDPPRVVMPLVARVAGEAAGVVGDLAGELAAGLPWGRLGETVVPGDTIAFDAIADAEGLLTPGIVIVMLAPDQPPPAYADGGALPDQGDVRLVLVQPVTYAPADRPRLVARRREVLDVVCRLQGRIREERGRE